MPKLKLVRVVTASYVVPWHLGNTLSRIGDEFEITVVGQGVSAYRAHYPGVRWLDIELNRKIDLLDDVRALYQLCRFFRNYRPDVVHSIMPKAGLLSALAGFVCRVPVRIHTFTGQVWAAKQGKAWRLLYWLDRLINGLNTVCLTDSPSQSAFLFRQGISHAGRPLPVLGHGSLSGVDLARFANSDIEPASSEIRRQLGLRSDQFVFAFIARKTRDKGAFDVLEAFAEISRRYPQAVLLFVGPDESEGELERLKQIHPGWFLQVLEIGEVSHHEHYLAISNVLCLPSYREGFGSIIIDAAAMGVPAIGSRIVGLVDSVEDGNTGILFDAGDKAQLAQAMQRFLEQPGLAESMGLAARRRVASHFSADLLYAELKCFYLNLFQAARN